MCGLPGRRIRHQRPIRRSAGETWPARYRAGHRNQLDSGRARRAAKIGGCGEGTSGCDWSVGEIHRKLHHSFGVSRFLNSEIQKPPNDVTSNTCSLADTLRNLTHARLVDLDLLPGLHALLDFLAVGTEVLLPSSR